MKKLLNSLLIAVLIIVSICIFCGAIFFCVVACRVEWAYDEVNTDCTLNEEMLDESGN